MKGLTIPGNRPHNACVVIDASMTGRGNPTDRKAHSAKTGRFFLCPEILYGDRCGACFGMAGFLSSRFSTPVPVATILPWKADVATPFNLERSDPMNTPAQATPENRLSHNQSTTLATKRLELSIVKNEKVRDQGTKEGKA